LCGCVTSCKPLESIKRLSSSKHTEKVVWAQTVQFFKLNQCSCKNWMASDLLDLEWIVLCLKSMY
jgi:hypothetical protein